MKERPILFNGAMVRAILDGRKTQTRRIVSKRSAYADGIVGCIAYDCIGPRIDDASTFALLTAGDQGFEECACPYGTVGDRLWVRETFFYENFMHDQTVGEPDLPDGRYTHRLVHRASRPDYPLAGSEHWKPSIFMPRWASRITLEITAVRVERLQDITRTDIRAEGVMIPAHMSNEESYKQAYYDAWVNLWDSINGNRKDKHGNRLPYAWLDNPWVFVIEFKMIDSKKDC